MTAKINDAPFKEGDSVAIIRSRHGWFDGALTGPVVSRSRNCQGAWSYLVKDEEGREHEIAHTRDLTRV